MANYTEAHWNEKKVNLMEMCFNGFTELGLYGTGIRSLARHCGYNTSMIYTYFKDFDDLIIQSTAHCMGKCEDEFYMKSQIESLKDTLRFYIEKYSRGEAAGKKEETL